MTWNWITWLLAGAVVVIPLLLWAEWYLARQAWKLENERLEREEG